MGADSSQYIESNSFSNPAATACIIFLITPLFYWMPKSGVCILSLKNEGIQTSAVWPAAIIPLHQGLRVTVVYLACAAFRVQVSFGD